MPLEMLQRNYYLHGNKFQCLLKNISQPLLSTLVRTFKNINREELNYTASCKKYKVKRSNYLHDEHRVI